jgi:hypothetical protein
MKTVEECCFQPEPENEIYLSLIEPAWRGTAINKALSQFLTKTARIDIADGRGEVDFWRGLDTHKKAEVLRRLGPEGSEQEKAEPEIWEAVIKTKPIDFYVMAAKYLALYKIKHGKPWKAQVEITGEKTRKLAGERAAKRKAKR